MSNVFSRYSTGFLLLAVLIVSLLVVTRAEAQLLNLERLVMPGPVIEAHASIEESCDSCHVDNDADSQDLLCGSCHTDVQADRDAGRGFHGLHPEAFDFECFSCHQEHEGRNAQAVQFEPETFNHLFTDFPLDGAHEQAACTDCHAAGTTFRQAEEQCSDCHGNEDIHMGLLGSNCESCHVSSGWEAVTFDHSTTLFPLRAAHEQAECVDCHRNQTFVGTPLQCDSCHREDDVHDGRNGADCASCHVDTSWVTTDFDHWMVSGFALEGRHDDLSCQSCHTADLASALPETCIGCHADEDIHNGRLGDNCASCHSPGAWIDTGFEHLSQTGFALTGVHADADCADCHVESVAAALPTDCGGCHSPDPHQNQLGSDCAACHGDVAWNLDVLFDHGLTTFPLIGLHAQAQCTDCHATPAFHDAGDNCVDCHAEADYHGGALGDTCASCHSPVSWQAWMFDHSSVSQFPLTGAHEELGCASCHQEELSSMLTAGMTCASCHRHDDTHDGLFGTDCGSCHTTDAFLTEAR
jgi:hypothetical protein